MFDIFCTTEKFHFKGMQMIPFTFQQTTFLNSIVNLQNSTSSFDNCLGKVALLYYTVYHFKIALYPNGYGTVVIVGLKFVTIIKYKHTSGLQDQKSYSRD